MLSVAGSIGVITSIVIGADCGVLIYGIHAPLSVAIHAGAAAGALATTASTRFQSARWDGAISAQGPADAETVPISISQLGNPK
jgi:hypothetical protein